MSTPTITPGELIDELEKNPPVIYAKVSIPVKNKKGEVKMKNCNLNLVTGDIYPNRKLYYSEESNFALVRQHGDFGAHRIEPIVHYAYQKAEITDAGITIATWVYGDYVNYPGTAKFEARWYGSLELFPEEGEEPIDEKALAHVKLSPPRIAAMAVITQDKAISLWQDVEKYGYHGPLSGDYHGTRYLSDGLLNAISHAADAKRVVNLTECFKTYFDIGYVGANKYVTFDSYKDVPRFMKASEMKLKKGPKQDVVDVLVAYDLPDHSLVSAFDQVICYADRVNQEWTVLRWHSRVGPSRYIETSRMYVNKNEAVMCRSNLKGAWIHSAVKIKAETFNADKVVMQSESVFDGTKLEYFKTISKKLSNQSAALYMMTTYPEFEKLYKVGFDWLCNNYLESIYQMSWKNYVENYCGHVDWKAKSVFKMIGINNHQARAIQEYLKRVAEMNVASWEKWYVNTTVRTLKNIFNMDEINSVDNETFDYILNSMCRRDRISNNYAAALAKTFAMYGKDAIYFIKDLNAVSTGKRTVSVLTPYGFTSQMQVDTLYNDTLKMIQSSAHMDVIRPRFSTVEELANHHQVMVDLINAENEEKARMTDAQHKAGFQKFQQRWKQWEWEGDEQFCVIAPEKPVDVAAEGITLRHCVKSFIPSLAMGQTNVLFIRRKGQEDVPFFTVEVDNMKNIRQIHGMCNCNVDSVLGLEEFVVKWAKKKRLNYVSSSARRLRAAEH